jgi:hypothetical protein
MSQFIINVININKLMFGKMTKKEELSFHIARRQQLHITHANLKYFGLAGIVDSVPSCKIWRDLKSVRCVDLILYFKNWGIMKRK